MASKKLSDEYVIKYLKDYIEKIGQVPSMTELPDKSVVDAISNRWGWNNTIIKLGYKPKINSPRKKYKSLYNADFITLLTETKNEIDKFLKKNNRLPMLREFNKLELPIYLFYRKKLDTTYNDLLIDVCGYDQELLSTSCSK